GPKSYKVLHRRKLQSPPQHPSVTYTYRKHTLSSVPQEIEENRACKFVRFVIASLTLITKFCAQISEPANPAGQNHRCGQITGSRADGITTSRYPDMVRCW